MKPKPYQEIIAKCESYLAQHGDNYLGVGWTKRPEDAQTRYRVMLELLPETPDRTLTLLDFGCGAAHLYEYIQRSGHPHIDYAGLDLSPQFLTLSRSKFPTVRFYDVDVLENTEAIPSFDYVIMNGIFNSKCNMSFDEMVEYFEALVTCMFAKTRVGLAFNVMSKQVEWERDDLFHLPLDILASFLAGSITRHFVVRHDYGLFEYTTYVYRLPVEERR